MIRRSVVNASCPGLVGEVHADGVVLGRDHQIIAAEQAASGQGGVERSDTEERAVGRGCAAPDLGDPTLRQTERAGDRDVASAEMVGCFLDRGPADARESDRSLLVGRQQLGCPSSTSDRVRVPAHRIELRGSTCCGP